MNNSSIQGVIRPRTKLEQRHDLEPHYGFEKNCSNCSGDGWRPTVGDGSNWCPCFYQQPGDTE